MDILKELGGGDRRSIGKANRIVALVLKTPELFDDVMRGLRDGDPLIQMRCADVAEKVSAARPDWLQRHKRDILLLASKVQAKEVRWHMAQMVPRLRLTAGDRQKVIALLFEYFKDESRIVKTCAMQALFDMSRSDRRLRSRVVPVLRAALENGSGATRSRARKLLEKIR